MFTPRKQQSFPAVKVTSVALDLSAETIWISKPMAISADEVLIYESKPGDIKGVVQAFRINIITGEKRTLPSFLPDQEISRVVSHRTLKCIPLLYNQCAFISSSGMVFILNNLTDELVGTIPLPVISEKPLYTRIDEVRISCDKKTLCVAIKYPEYYEYDVENMQLYFIIDLPSKRIITLEETFVILSKTAIQFMGFNTLGIISSYDMKPEGLQNKTNPLLLSLIHFNFNSEEPSYSRQEIPIPAIQRPKWSPLNISSWSRNLLPPGILRSFYLWDNLMVIDFAHINKNIRNRILYLCELDPHNATLTYIKEIARGCTDNPYLQFLHVSNVILFWNQEGNAMQFDFRTRECEAIPMMNRDLKVDYTFNLMQMADDRVLFCNKLIELNNVTNERASRYKLLFDRIHTATSNKLNRDVLGLVTDYLPIQDYPLTLFRTIALSIAHDVPESKSAAGFSIK